MKYGEPQDKAGRGLCYLKGLLKLMCKLRSGMRAALNTISKVGDELHFTRQREKSMFGDYNSAISGWVPTVLLNWRRHCSGVQVQSHTRLIVNVDDESPVGLPIFVGYSFVFIAFSVSDIGVEGTGLKGLSEGEHSASWVFMCPLSLSTHPFEVMSAVGVVAKTYVSLDFVFSVMELEAVFTSHNPTFHASEVWFPE